MKTERLAALVAIACVACGDDDNDVQDAWVAPEDRAIPGRDSDVPEASPLIDTIPLTLEDGPIEITKFRFIPGTMELLALDLRGGVHHYEIDGDALRELGSFTLPVFERRDCGLLSFTFDPEFDHNGYVYFSQCFSMTESGVVRATFTPDDYDDVPETVVEIFRAGHPEAVRPWHNVGDLGFEPSGVMWILFGEKVLGDPASDRSSNLGAVVRLVPREGGGADPATDNPYLGDDDASPFVYAKGLRSPWNGVRDTLGRLWFSDVGAAKAEELNVVDGPGLYFGWPHSEGPCREDCEGEVDPVLSYGRSYEEPYVLDDELVEPSANRVMWLGLQYGSSGVDRYEGHLDGSLLFGDMCLGFVRAIDAGERDAPLRDRHIGHLRFASSWAEGPDGFIYVVTFGHCESGEPDPPPASFYRVVLRDD